MGSGGWHDDEHPRFAGRRSASHRPIGSIREPCGGCATRFIRSTSASPRRSANCRPTPAPALAGKIEFHPLALASRHDSQLDGATKLVFRTAGDLFVEAVILRLTSGRTTLCVSMQVGCAARCDFCATGKMGLARNLTAAEIVDQLVQANHLLAPEGRSIRNVVFMGMGEPFHNEPQLHAALELLAHPACFHLNLQRADGFDRRHSPGDGAIAPSVGRKSAKRSACTAHGRKRRRRLMPLADRHGLDELRTAIEHVIGLTGQLVMIEYLLLADVNDQPDDADALVEFLRGLAVHVNLIPYNPIDGAPHLAASPRERQAAFSAKLKSAGLKVTTRYSLGTDVTAACGQLATANRTRT